MVFGKEAVEELKAGFGAHRPTGADLGRMVADLGVEVGPAVGGEDRVVDLSVALAEVHDGRVGVGGVVDVVVGSRETPSTREHELPALLVEGTP